MKSFLWFCVGCFVAFVITYCSMMERPPWYKHYTDKQYGTYFIMIGYGDLEKGHVGADCTGQCNNDGSFPNKPGIEIGSVYTFRTREEAVEAVNRVCKVVRK